MNQPVLTARIRKSKGKGAAKKLRKMAQIPAVFYGPKTEPVMLAVDYPELERLLKQGSSDNVILDLQVQSDQGTETRKAMLKDLLIDPIKDIYLHADFYEISMDKEITVDVPIRLVNSPVGVTEGGILQHIKRELKISCLPGKMINALELDVSGLDIGDSLHVEDIKLPEGILSLDDGDLTIATVAAPTVAEEAEKEVIEEGLAEGEVAESEQKAESTEESKA
ncbi:MAG: 50S ribosomal protein L25 [Desulfobacterales bacterium]|jgi:large subunit ribosomal protein L25|nr:50S ribosomal protein L25 [Pseudomonadota bacterium]MCG2776459.1 50S ribosomal protein L25 [Desulfobacterales bacterium]